MALGLGLGGLRFNANYNAYFDDNAPVLKIHRDVQQAFAQYDGVIVALEFNDSVFSADIVGAEARRSPGRPQPPLNVRETAGRVIDQSNIC